MVDMLTPVAPPPSAPSLPDTSGMDENAIREAFSKAAQNGMSVDDLNATITLNPQAQAASTPGQPVATPEPVVVQKPQPQAVVPPVVEVPKKFQKPDGTVDEDKLKTSSDALDEALKSRARTIEEMMADYKARERQLQQMNEQASHLKNTMPQTPAPQGQPTQAQVQQIMQDYQRDPIGTILGLAQVVADQKLAPIQENLGRIAERERDGSMRDNLAALAKSDPRILDPRIYPVFKAELDSEPGYFNLKNPHKAAWNEVKERLRLGEPTGVQAQPSNSGVTLTPGAPPSVSQLPSVPTTATLGQQVQTANPYSDEGKRLEDQMRQMFANLGGGF